MRLAWVPAPCTMICQAAAFCDSDRTARPLSPAFSQAIASHHRYRLADHTIQLSCFHEDHLMIHCNQLQALPSRPVQTQTFRLHHEPDFWASEP